MSEPADDDTGFRARVGRDYERFRGSKPPHWGRLRLLLEASLVDAGFQALFLHRVAHALRRRGVPVIPALCRRLSIAWCGVDILPGADIGGGCVLAHGLGLVIGGTAVIGRDCTLLHGVTLGEARFDETACPRLGDRVVLGARATLLGGITVGDDAIVAAGSVVNRDVPARALAAGVPARIRPDAVPGPGSPEDPPDSPSSPSSPSSNPNPSPKPPDAGDPTP